jgi:hypothetical protein
MLEADMLLAGLAGRPPTDAVKFGNGEGEALAGTGIGFEALAWLLKLS